MAALTPLFLLLLLTPLSARTLTRYALLLQDPPAGTSRSAQQKPLLSELARRKITVTGVSQLLLNAIYVVADPARKLEISRLPGVRRIVFLPTLKPALDHAEQLVNTSAAWTLLNGPANAGLGIKIAVIDSGIDQTHPAFQDPRLTPPPGYPVCQPQYCAFTNSKVIVARSYIPQDSADDYSPRDHQGHGTAVAMVIAGETNTGPGDTITGLAPKAFLGNYKVFGSPGINDSASADAVIQALEDAVNDGMDIANLSLGGPALTGALDSGAACGEGPGVPCDPLSQAVENATSLGLLVVVAAGNDGGSALHYPALATVETPSIAPSAISVSATTNSHIWIPSSSGFTPEEVSGYNTVASFTSRGPAIGAASVKPEMAAVGTNFFLATQNYDPGGDFYNILRYNIGSGTSFAAPMVAGAAALVKQLNPTWQPWQIKSALVNTVTQDVTDNGQTAGVTAVGAGKLNVANALSTTLVVNPPTLSLTTAPNQAVQIQNNGATTANLQVTSSGAPIAIDQTNLTIPPGETATLQVSVTPPSPGSYEGAIVLQGGVVPLHIPYLYLVTDGVPQNLISLSGDGDFGLAGQPIPDGILAFEVIDQYGLPVPNLPVSFGVTKGGGEILAPDPATNQYGIATAQAITGATQSLNVFTGIAAGMTVQFTDTGVPQPTIAPYGVVNAASFQAGPGIAPGSYVSIFGSNLSTANIGETTPNLPVSLQGVSVSFDVPEANLSLPGHLIYVTPQQINLQVPWELQGQPSVQMKVSIYNASGAVSTVPVSDASPGIFVPQGQITAVRGQSVTLYGTGFGPVNHPPASGDPAADATSTTLLVPTVTIAGVPAAVEFSGLAPGYAGLYQVDILVPSNVPPGAQPLDVTMNGIAADTVLLQLQ
jgi:uncharacterized protein (TIGR03437 family)